MAQWTRSGSSKVGAYGVFDVHRHDVARDDAGGCHRAGEQALEDLEDCEVLLIDRDDLYRRLAAGEITHALVWTALLAHRLHEERSR